VLDAAEAQRVEWQGQAVHAARDSMFLGAGVSVGLRFPGRTAFQLSTSLGRSAGVAVFRTEVAARFHLVSTWRRRTALYGLAGLAFEYGGGRQGKELMLISLGLESRPVLGLRWFVESGLGGGYRLAAGVRIIT